MKVQEQEHTYVKRQIVARLDFVGNVDDVMPFYRYLTIWNGPNEKATAVRFRGFARVDKDGFMDYSLLKPGDIVISPGLVYEPVTMTGQIMAAHLKRMQTWKPKEEIVYEKSDEAPVDLGALNNPEGD